MSFVAPFAATLIVSTLPICALFFIPRRGGIVKVGGQARASEDLLNVMLCFSAGALIGDALLHILMHSIFSQEPTEERVRSLIMSVLVGIVFFFSCELSVRMIHFSPEPQRSNEVSESPRKKQNKPKAGMTNRKVVPPDTEHSHCTHHHGHYHCHSHSQTGGILSLFADALHNFMDGLALAVTFHKSFSIGVATAMAIFVHEVPHQIGDYAMLVKSGYSHLHAIKMQLYTAASAGVGVIFGYGVVRDFLPGASLIHNDDLLCFIGGGFLYVACVSIIPEVLAPGANQKCSWTDCAVKLIAMVAGVALMAVMD